MEKFDFELFIHSDGLRSSRAVENLREICRKNSLNYDLEIRDIQDQTEESAKKNIWATPTLIKKSPKPVRRLIGDLSDSEKVLRFLKGKEGTVYSNE